MTIPLFIGYTAQVEESGVPVALASLAEANARFGETGTLAWALRHFSITMVAFAMSIRLATRRNGAVMLTD
ncbi:hypothetical protein CWS02_00480 [Enterobacter sp. EA-1]|nr:hypothetical protein CWS02_00480 [Enterobacter sp. EA-1]